MCGINGVIYKSPVSIEIVNNQINKMNDLITHRGPDDDGVFANQTETYSIGMGMRRLSIIDLSSGKQPMYSEDKKITIVFNGEIYNFKTIKQQLQQKGVLFKTNSDTEVVLKLYETYGKDGFKQLDGMFGFSIYDTNLQKVFIARDYFGEKPLYYYNSDTELYWGSELKSLINSLKSKPEIDIDGFNLYFRLTYIPAPYTIYKGVKKLEANNYIEYDLSSKSFSIHKIHHVIIPKTKINISFNDAKKEVKDLIYKSVESRSISDVPLGTFLSGGVDSSVISVCLAEMSDTKIDTFSIGFEKTTFDESDKARTVAKIINSNHNEFIINESDLKQNVDEILLNFDEPFADSSALPTYLVSNKTKSNVTVALTGDGGDEVFGGYNKYYIGKLNSRYTQFVPEFVHNQIKKASAPFLQRKEDSRGVKFKLDRLISAIDYKHNHYWDIISLGINADDVQSLIKEEYRCPLIFDYYKNKTGISNPKTLTDFRITDSVLSLEGDMLVKVERTSMLNSLECRAPFLNRELFEYTLQLPENYLLHKWSKKHILKEAFRDKFPKNFLEISKQGFGVPVGDWLRDGLKNELLSYIEPQFLKTQNIFNTTTIIELVDNHISGKKDNTFKVWTYYCFQKWYTRIYLK